MVPLRVLGDRVLIKPIENPTETASGLILAEHRKPETMGTVVAVGLQTHPLRADAEALAVQVEQDFPESGPAIAELLRCATQRTPDVHVGDTVIFSWTSGQEIFIDDEEPTRHLLMREADVLAVLEE